MSTTSIPPDVGERSQPAIDGAPAGEGLHAARWLVLAIVLCAEVRT